MDFIVYLHCSGDNKSTSVLEVVLSCSGGVWAKKEYGDNNGYHEVKMG